MREDLPPAGMRGLERGLAAIASAREALTGKDDVFLGRHWLAQDKVFESDHEITRTDKTVGW